MPAVAPVTDTPGLDHTKPTQSQHVTSTTMTHCLENGFWETLAGSNEFEQLIDIPCLTAEMIDEAI